MPVPKPIATNPSAVLDPANRRRVLLWGGAVCCTILGMRVPMLGWPVLLLDDFQILAQSWTWQTMLDNLWVPANEHSMPLGRISTWALIYVGGQLTDVARLLCFQGPLAITAAAVLVYLLVQRETGHPLPALLAMTLFGVSTHYWQAVIWFAASFATLGLDMCLLGLLAAQRWRQLGRPMSLVLSACWCALAPGWFGTGVLAGPLCTLYLLGTDRDSARRLRGWLLSVVPCLGTAISLAITMPRNAERILTMSRDSFDPLIGLEYTLRSMVDDVIPGMIGIREITIPQRWVWLCLGILVMAFVWWWRIAPQRGLLLLGLGMIVGSYLLIFTARANKDYEDMHHWSRYQLYPHLGLVLIVCGGLPRRWYPVSLAAIPHCKAAVFLGVVVLVQLASPFYFHENTQQLKDIRRIEEVDARCRRFHIDAATARTVLPEPFLISGCEKDQTVNGRTLSGWDFLRGSDDPQPVAVEDARRMLDLSRQP